MENEGEGKRGVETGLVMKKNGEKIDDRYRYQTHRGHQG